VKASRLVVNPITCDGYGICHELFPERIGLDDWGFPIISDAPIDPEDARHAKRVVSACPRLALRLVAVPTPAPVAPNPRSGPTRPQH
jgi:ferredoxin